MQMTNKKRAVLIALGMVLTTTSCSFDRREVALEERERIETETVEPTSPIRLSEAELNETEGSLETASVAVSSVSAGCYAYETLSAEAKAVYDEILNCILNHLDEITVSTLDPEVIGASYEAVNADHGGLFWIRGYVYTKYMLGDRITHYTFAPKYTMDQNERRLCQEKIDIAAADFLSGISISDPDYEKAKYVYETLVNRVDYDVSAAENQNILSVFLHHRTVCQGYSSAMQYLLTQLGIESVIITGKADRENHAWVAAKLDGDYYYIDPTFGNSAYTGSGADAPRFVNYTYLNITGEELKRNHEIHTAFPAPECVADADNYFVREGLYFEEFLPDRIGKLLQDSWDGDRHMVSMKFADTNLYDEAFEYFITDQHIGDWCVGLSSLRYVDDEARSVLMIGFSED